MKFYTSVPIELTLCRNR